MIKFNSNEEEMFIMFHLDDGFGLHERQEKTKKTTKGINFRYFGCDDKQRRSDEKSRADITS